MQLRLNLYSGLVCFVAFASIFSLSGCVPSKFPLCAKLSKEIPSDIPGVSKTLYDVCKARHIKITPPLSSTIVELKGGPLQMKWLKNNYFIIICDFDQEVIQNDEAVYTACMGRSKQWIKIVQGKNPGGLMADGLGYCALCCEGYEGREGELTPKKK